MAAKKRAKAGSKSDFIRSMPQARAVEVVEAAKKAGITMSTQLVYVVRTNDKSKGRGRGFVRRGSRGHGAGNAEAALRSAIAQLGLSASRAILEDFERRFGR